MRLGSAQAKRKDEKTNHPRAAARRRDRERFIKRHRSKLKRQGLR